MIWIIFVEINDIYIYNSILLNMKEKKNILKDSNINGSRVYVENGDVKTQLSEEIQRNGYMSVEESRKITLEAVKKIYELNA